MLVTSTLFSPFHTLTLAPFPAHQLPGDSPHTPSVPNDEEMVRQNEHGQALPRLNFAASTDDQAAASHGEGAPQGDRDRAGGREEREAERSAGAGAAVSGPGVGVGGGHTIDSVGQLKRNKQYLEQNYSSTFMLDELLRFCF